MNTCTVPRILHSGVSPVSRFYGAQPIRAQPANPLSEPYVLSHCFVAVAPVVHFEAKELLGFLVLSGSLQVMASESLSFSAAFTDFFHLAKSRSMTDYTHATRGLHINSSKF